MSTDENSAEMMPNRRSVERARATGSWSLFGLILFGGLVMSLASGAEPEASDAPRPTMRAVFAEMKVLIPLSLSESEWSDPKNRKQILEALDRLERAADTLRTTRPFARGRIQRTGAESRA